MSTAGNPDLPLPLQLLEEVCAQDGYSFDILDKHSNNLVRVTYQQRRFYAGANQIGIYPGNDHQLTRLVEDKAWTAQVLQEAGLPVLTGAGFFLDPTTRHQRGPGREWIDALAFARDRYPVFAKPNHAERGELARLLFDEAQLDEHLQQIARQDSMAVIQEFVQQPEYRLFVYRGQLQFFYEKSAACLTGDGQATVQELLDRFHETLPNPAQRIKLQDLYFKNQLQEHGLHKQSVLRRGQQVPLRAHNSIAGGGQITGFSQDAPTALQSLVHRIHELIPLNVCGIDLFSSDLNDPDCYKIIEINHRPGLNGLLRAGHRAVALEVLRRVLADFFQK